MIDEALVEILEGVTENIYPQVMPQKPTYPSVVYRRMDVDEEMLHDGPSGSPTDSFELWVYSLSYLEVREVAEQMSALLGGYTEEVDGERSMVIFVDGQTGKVWRLDDKFLFTETIRIRVWHRDGDYTS